MFDFTPGNNYNGASSRRDCEAKANGRRSKLARPSPPLRRDTIYVNPYYIVTHYSNYAEVTKHYYNGTARLAAQLEGDYDYLDEVQPLSGENNPVEEDGKALMADLNFQEGVDYDPQELYQGEEATYAHIVITQEDFDMQVSDLYGDLPPMSTLPCNISMYWPFLSNGVNCNGAGVMYFYHPDYGTSRATMARSAARIAIVMRDLGNTEYITDLNGEAYQYFHYSPFGEALVENKSNLGTHTDYFRFNGKELDPETGNYYYGARYYDPKVSVWLSVDPKAHWYPGHCPYNFSLNNPINLQDPNGMWVEGAGFFRNVFNSDEKILAQDLAAENGGEAFKHGDAWRATWTTQNNEKVEGVDVNMDDLHIVDFKKGAKRDGTYDSGVQMLDTKFDNLLNDNMRSGVSSWMSFAEPLDQEIAPKVAKTAATWLPPAAVINSTKTISTGSDLYGNKKEGALDRYIRPGIALIPEAGGILNKTSKGTEALDRIDKIINGYETYGIWTKDKD